MDVEMEFTKDDCWIILSIANNSKGSLLHEIVAMSDALNHAIPSEREMLQGLTKGIQSGLIRKKGNRFQYTPEFRNIHAEVFNQKGGLFTKIETLHKFLKRSRYSKLNDFETKFEAEEYEKAYREYAEFFQNTRFRKWTLTPTKRRDHQKR